jgi:O-antigen/teichoic acid export membrane protein
MVTLTVENRDSVPPIGRGLVAVREFGLRIVGAALQIGATVAVVQVLPPAVAGIYFKGVIIAYGLAALLRGKYELFVAQHFVNPRQSELGARARAVVRALGIRVLIRSALACAALLVVTADLDVMDVYLRPYLQTYLPFVLAVPFATLALFLASTLRATNRSLGSVIVSSYSINVMIITAGIAVTLRTEDELLVLSWAFFVGSLLAALMGVLLTRHVFKVPMDSSRFELTAAEWREIYMSTGENGLTGLALAGLQWGPVCALAVLGTAVEIAEYGVVTRTAQVVDFLIPAVIFVPQSARFQSRLCRAMRTARGKLAVDLSVSLATTTTCVLAVAILTPWFISLYGAAYTGLTVLFVLLLLTQWVTGVSRPAIRRLAADWNLHRIRRVLFTSMSVAIILSVFGIDRFGTVAAAVGVLAGALLLNGQALESAFRRAGPGNATS